jgi:hypothetical protein
VLGLDVLLVLSHIVFGFVAPKGLCLGVQ